MVNALSITGESELFRNSADAVNTPSSSSRRRHTISDSDTSSIARLSSIEQFSPRVTA